MTFDEWFEENRNELEEMIRSNNTEGLVYECWLAGYKAGLDTMGNFAVELFKKDFI